MRLTRLPAVLVAAALLAGIASCATSIEGSGSLASDVVTGGPTPTATSDDPTEDPTEDPTGDPTSDSPTPDPTTPAPTANPVAIREKALCVLERAAISTINSQFNKSTSRDAQIQILHTGATTIRGQISRSGLPGTDGIRRTGQGVLDQLDRLATDASGGGSPSTNAYNVATQKFQKACNSIS
jgi:hypothetical protein